MIYYSVAANTPFNNSVLTYKSEKPFSVGQLVSVPLGKRTVGGCILKEEKSGFDEAKLKEIIGPFSLEWKLSDEHLTYLKWVAKYYHYPVGQHIFDTLPKPLKKPREVEFPFGSGKPLSYELLKEQEEAVTKITKNMDSFERYLVHGVTGSGKTTIYLKVFQETISKGKKCLFLVPEINLTPQFIETFKNHLNAQILTYHSSMSNSEKLKVWEITENPNAPYVLIGVRSSIFLPHKNLGVLVLDEEHDQSFKQEDRCPYHTRDIAIKLAAIRKIPIVLGSATPTLESLNALKDTSNYILLTKRPHELKMPTIRLVDSRKPKSGGYEDQNWPFTEESLNEIRERVNNNEQVLVFVNRLGFASYVQCRSCGRDFHCLNCSSSLKYFKKTQTLNCQFCDYKIPYPESCPDCGNLKLLQKGFGTEKLAEVLVRNFSEKKIERFDRDAVKTFNDLKAMLERFESREIDILVGTQMLSKGHNFKGVNLVVLLGVDSQLNFPDFRSNEKVYQLITQTAGRPGRSEKQGLVLIQSLVPENKIFQFIENYQQDQFYAEELEVRDILNYPPYSRLVAIYFTSRFYERASTEATKAAGLLNAMIKKHFSEVDLLGPRPAIIEKKANNFSWTLLLRSKNINQLHSLLDNFNGNFKLPSGVSIKVDVDPQTLS
jgi:primosomal protein N' (replication factor Y)